MDSKITPYSDCPNILRDFLFYMQTIKGRSLRTIDGYYIDLRTFFRFIARQKNLVSPDVEFKKIPISQIDINVIKDISLSDTYEFLYFLSSKQDNSPVTRSRKVSSIRAFFNYLTTKVNLLSVNPILELEVPSAKKSLPKYLSLEQCYTLLKSIQGEYQLRDYCIITLFLNCGMRLSELVGLNLGDVNDDKIRLLGKGNKERIVYLNDACILAIKEYMPFRSSLVSEKTTEKALFLNRNGKRIGARRVEQIVDDNLKLAGLEQFGFSTHKLRHTAATVMYQNGGVDIRVLQEILGHVSLGTTQIYTHTSSEQMKAASKSTPLSMIKPPVNGNTKK